MGIKNILLTTAGIIFLGLGAIGLFLPVWPTTPFVLAAVGFLGCNPTLQEKVLQVPFVREYANSYYHKKGLSGKTVGLSLVFLWTMLLLSALTIKKLWLTCLLAVIGISVTIHIVWVSRDRSILKKGRKGAAIREK